MSPPEGRERNSRKVAASGSIQPRDGADLLVVEADAGDESAVGQPDHLRAADGHAQVAPGPRRVGRPGRAEHAGPRALVAAEQAEERAVVEEHEPRLVGGFRPRRGCRPGARTSGRRGSGRAGRARCRRWCRSRRRKPGRRARPPARARNRGRPRHDPRSQCSPSGENQTIDWCRASPFGLPVPGRGGDDHEPAVGSDVDLGIRRSAIGRVSEGDRGPFAAVSRADDPDRAVRRHVPLPFAEHAEPAVVEPHQVGERVVRALVPDLPDLDELGPAGLAPCSSEGDESENRQDRERKADHRGFSRRQLGGGPPQTA